MTAREPDAAHYVEVEVLGELTSEVRNGVKDVVKKVREPRMSRNISLTPPTMWKWKSWEG